MSSAENQVNDSKDIKDIKDTKDIDLKSQDIDLKKILKEKFNISEFRTHQEQIVKDILAKRDLLVLMPTGGGKSLCYQLSALISPGFSLIISPLIALIWDQIEDLKEKGIEARAWSSDLTASEMFSLKESIKNGVVKILYTTPEMLMQSTNLNNLLNLMQPGETTVPVSTSVSEIPAKTSRDSTGSSKYLVETSFGQVLDHNRNSSVVTPVKQRLLDRIVVDEAHCVSNWGHEFRESYLELVKMKQRLPGIQIVAFTATATPAVQLDIIRILNLSRVKIYRQSYIRENLHYFVKKRETSSKLKFSETFIDQICQWIRENDYTRKTGIVYCLSRDNSEELAEALVARGLSAECFHASLPLEDKRLTQMRWLSGETKIIVATIAFALGINKPNVRFVIHAALPKSIEGFYQETGRAGRDGKLSRCLLFYNRQDKHILQSMARKSASTAAPTRGFKTATEPSKGLETGSPPTDSIVRTEDMYQWANSNLDCRIESLSRYLGENVTFTCGNCDNCRLASAGNKRIQPIRRSIKDFLTYAVNSINNDPRGFKRREDLLEDISTDLSHYAGYDRFRVLAQLQALGYLDVKFQLDRDNEIHANVFLGPLLRGTSGSPNAVGPRSTSESKQFDGDVHRTAEGFRKVSEASNVDEELMMNFTNGTLDNFIYVPSR